MTETRDMYFTVNHEWICVKSGRTALVGISDYGQGFLSEVTHVDVPEPDDQVYTAGEELGVVESLKNTLPFHCPVSGVITDSNRNLMITPETINEDPFGDGWIFKLEMSNPSELEELLTPEEYDHHLPDEDDE